MNFIRASEELGLIPAWIFQAFPISLLSTPYLESLYRVGLSDATSF
jgi:hypothetical protein